MWRQFLLNLLNRLFYQNHASFKLQWRAAINLTNLHVDAVIYVRVRYEYLHIGNFYIDVYGIQQLSRS